MRCYSLCFLLSSRVRFESYQGHTLTICLTFTICSLQNIRTKHQIFNTGCISRGRSLKKLSPFGRFVVRHSHVVTFFFCLSLSVVLCTEMNNLSVRPASPSASGIWCKTKIKSRYTTLHSTLKELLSDDPRHLRHQQCQVRFQKQQVNKKKDLT